MKYKSHVESEYISDKLIQWGPNVSIRMSHKRGRGHWSNVKTTNLISSQWLIFHPSSIRNGLLNVSLWRICRTNVYNGIGQYHKLLIVDQSVNNMVDGLSHTVGLFSTLTLWCCLQVGVDAWLHDKVLKKVRFFSPNWAFADWISLLLHAALLWKAICLVVTY